ncbi:hypothetical protein FRB95_004350 [Tulasnella sp. JGI-2019a]|nr:hypothetical protein FRB93_000362 [Tulasnella sp. JGI-2019a]KAG9039878.1 hypothetical protein FRB95_004350 [Tulasnella sp. JGI-2019a]
MDTNSPRLSNLSVGSPVPYNTPNHSVSKGRYITSSDPRGYVPVYEYPLNNQWIMMDADDGYILWTGIWKALGNSKADVLRMIEAQPELAMQLRRVRGGYLKIQGTWLPFDVALRLARRVAWPIRDDLVPLFGPTFPDSCLSPDQPGFGQPIENLQKRKHRRAHVNNGPSTSSTGGYTAGPNGVTGPDRVYKPYSPTSPPGTNSPNNERYPERSRYREDPSPSSSPGAYSPTLPNNHERTSEGQGGHQKFAPYPSTGPTPDAGPTTYNHRRTSPGHASQSSRRQSSSTHSRDLPSISAFLPRPTSSSSSRSDLLPNIGSIRDMVSRPELDASTVLKRLKLDEAQCKVDHRSPVVDWVQEEGGIAPWDAASHLCQQRPSSGSGDLFRTPNDSLRNARRPASPFSRPFPGGRSSPAVPQYRPGADASGRPVYLDRFR